MRYLLFAFFLPLIALAQGSYLTRAPLSADDPFARPQAGQWPIRAITFDDGSKFYIERSSELEAFGGEARVASLHDAGGTIVLLRAGEWIPRGSIMPGTAGQIFGAALLPNHRTLAVSFGWTNARGRNLNGIAILDRKNDDWTPRNVIVLDGCIRDLIAVGNDEILAATTRFHGRGLANDKQAFELALLSTSGQLRAQIVPVPYPESGAGPVTVIAAADQAELHPIDGGFVLLDRIQGLISPYKLHRAGNCTGAVSQRDDHFFLYPSYASTPCVTAEQYAGSSLPVPNGGNMQLRAARNFGNGPVEVWSSADGMLVRRGANNTVRYDGVSWQDITIRPDSIDAVETSASGRARIRVKVP